jgi:HPt (histidine-containing phosphotransfer) domain-containing protein
MTTVLDADRLTALGEDLGEAEFVEQTLRIYLGELPKRQAAMNAALRADDRGAMSGVAHSLKSASALFGAYEVEAICLTVELQAPTMDGVHLASTVDELNAACDRVRTAMNAWLAAQGSNR